MTRRAMRSTGLRSCSAMGVPPSFQCRCQITGCSLPVRESSWRPNPSLSTVMICEPSSRITGSSPQGVFLSAPQSALRDYIDSKRLGAHLTDVASFTFERCDVMLTAISLTTAPRIAQSTRPGAWPLQASPWNLTGHPAIAVPMSLSPRPAAFVGATGRTALGRSRNSPCGPRTRAPERLGRRPASC